MPDLAKEQVNGKLTPQEQFGIDIKSGLFTGIFCSGLFNPWDRALYLSVKNNRSFLSKENFKNPYQGFSQALVQRAFLGSAYYIIQGELKFYAYPYLRTNLNASETVTQFLIGASAGCMSGLLTNSTSAIKHHTWGQANRTFFSSAYDMWSKGGIKPFMKGTTATMGRDIAFGSTYEVSRNLMQHRFSSGSDLKGEQFNFIYNGISATFATIVSGPLNYARTTQYATLPQVPTPNTVKVLKDVWSESKKHQTSIFSRASFFQQKFRVGWGTARVAVGMAVGQEVFEAVRSGLMTKRP